MEISNSQTSSQTSVTTRARARARTEAKRKFSQDLNFNSGCRHKDAATSTPAVFSTNGHCCFPPVRWCYSSNGSSQLVNRSWRYVADLEEFENLAHSFKREKTGNHSQSNNMDGVKMPTDSEIEEFFCALENDEKKRFTEKYNFDIEKDIPLEGRYEWSQVKPSDDDADDDDNDEMI